MSFYEDIVVGEPHAHGNYEIARDEIVAFARRYDPQDFHLSDEAAARGPFRRLAASGWMTAAVTMRMMVEDWDKRGVVSKGGAGVEELKWHRPVYPGDVLSVRGTVLSKRRSASRPELGIVRTLVETLDARGEVVMSMISNGMVATRDPDGND